MLYRITRIFMTITLRLFYRRVYATGIETIPEKGPVILLANHPSSLMDAALLGILLKRPIHYFTRGDVFKYKLISAIFSALNMIPVFDHAGRKTLRDNDDSFLKAKKILKDGGLVLFFPEGNSHIDRKLASLKKGAFRLAFQAADELPLHTPFLIIPAGINYAHPFASQTDVVVQIGDPLDVRDYLEKYKAHPTSAILQLKKDSELTLIKNVAHIELPERLTTADVCLEITRNDYSYFTTHWMQATKNRFEEEKKLCNAINKLTTEEAADLEGLVNDYKSGLNRYRLSDYLISENGQLGKSAEKKLVAGFPLFVVSYVLNALPVLIAGRIADTKVKRADFYSWVFLTTAALLYFSWVLLLFFGFLVVGIRYALVITIIALALGPFTVFYINLRTAFKNQKHYNRLSKLNSEAMNSLKNQRKEIVELLRK